MIVGGYLDPWDTRATELNKLTYKSFTAIANIYSEQNFSIIADYVWDLNEINLIKSNLDNKSLVETIFLIPNEEINIQRNNKRNAVTNTSQIKSYRKQFNKIKQSKDYTIIDNSTLSVKEVVELIIL